MQPRYKTYPASSSAFGRFNTGSFARPLDMNEQSVRLKTAIKAKGITLRETAERTHFSYNTVKSNQNGYAPFSFDAAVTYARHLGVRAEWLYYGTDPMREPPAPRGRPPINIPLLSWVSAGQLLDSGMDNVEASESVIVADLPAGEYIATKVRGDSMDRVSPEGSTLIVRTDDRELRDGQYYLFSIRGETTFKRFYRDPVHRLEPFSTNPANRTIFLDGDGDWQVVGRVYRTILALA